ncbi:hypothetical protein D3C81_1420270 [compost metagenome]
MKYLVIFLLVKVTGPPLAICFLNSGITEPLLPNTLPNLTATNSVLLCLFIACIIISHILLEAPIILVGLTALSVEISTNLFTPALSAHSATFKVPKTLFLIASDGLSSIKGTCLCAAAWNTTSGLNSSKIFSTLFLSLTDAIIIFKSNLGNLTFNSF